MSQENQANEAKAKDEKDNSLPFKLAEETIKGQVFKYEETPGQGIHPWAFGSVGLVTVIHGGEREEEEKDLLLKTISAGQEQNKELHVMFVPGGVRKYPQAYVWFPQKGSGRNITMGKGCLDLKKIEEAADSGKPEFRVDLYSGRIDVSIEQGSNVPDLKGGIVHLDAHQGNFLEYATSTSDILILKYALVISCDYFHFK